MRCCENDLGNQGASLPNITKPAMKRKNRRVQRSASAESLAAQQREISVSEFFAKNRHLLGFDNPRKALLTTLKEAVDNALDACEEAGVLPKIRVHIAQLGETRFQVTVRDNGPGIVRKQIDRIFGQLLYGSKFHRLKMSRGQQGIGISAAGMYGLMTTGKPVLIISKVSKRKPSHRVRVKMDTTHNKPVVVRDEIRSSDDKLFPQGHGTQVAIELEARHVKGRQSIEEYLEQTGIANPHAQITYTDPAGESLVFASSLNELPTEPREIKPHPKGIELGTLIQMCDRTAEKHLGGFLRREFCRIGSVTAEKICRRAGLTPRTWIKRVGHSEAERLYRVIQGAKINAPPTDCLVPIGPKALLAGLKKKVKANFYTVYTRPPAVYRGNPFQIEAAIAYGGELPRDEPAQLIRFANRVPLLYRQTSCCAFKSVTAMNWKNYGLTQTRASLPNGPLVIVVHMATVWAPFTSESKEAIACYDEIHNEMRLALRECARKLRVHLRRLQYIQNQLERRDTFARYIGEIARSCEHVTGTSAELLRKALEQQARSRTVDTATSVASEQQPNLSNHRKPSTVLDKQRDRGAQASEREISEDILDRQGIDSRSTSPQTKRETS